HLTFTVPGATAEVQGTYDLISKRINLRGTLYMTAKLSQATTGVKSFLLKVINPFTKKDKPNEPVWFRLTGTYEKPIHSVPPQCKTWLHRAGLSWMNARMLRVHN